MKKIFLKLGMLAFATVPVVSIVSCGTSSTQSQEETLLKSLDGNKTGDIKDYISNLFVDSTNINVLESAAIIENILYKSKDNIDIHYLKNVGKKSGEVSFDAITITPKNKTNIIKNHLPIPLAKSDLNISAPYAIVLGYLNGECSSISLQGNFVELSKELSLDISFSDIGKITQTITPNWALYIQFNIVMKPESHIANIMSMPRIHWSDNFTNIKYIKLNKTLERETIKAKDMTVDKIVNNFNQHVENIKAIDSIKLNPKNVSIRTKDYLENKEKMVGLEVSIKNYGPTVSFLLKGFKQ